MLISMRNLCGCLVLSCIAACGGGEDGTDISVGGGGTPSGETSRGSYVPLSVNDGARADSPLVVLSANSSSNSVRRQSANLDRSSGANGSVTGSVIAGSLNAARTRIALSSGEAVLTNPDNSVYARVFTSPSGPGIVGEATENGDDPRINTLVTYRGNAIVDVNDGQNVYALTGSSRVEADFATNRADVILSGLSGTANDGLNNRNTSNVLTIEIDNASISGGNALSGGAVSFTANQGTSVPLASTGFSGSQSVDHKGQFFGPLADEVGGVLVVDDPNAGSGLEMTGVYIGDATSRREN